MPSTMSGYIQSVLVDEVVYVGGGNTPGCKNDYIVITYDTHSRRWGTLPPYRTRFFGMTVIRDQLVLVGGKDKDGKYCKSLGVWRTDSEKWVDFYPDMPTPRSGSSVATYNEWLIVAGGINGELLSIVDVLNIDTKQWYSGPPAPRGFSRMKTATVGDMCYYMGGYSGGDTNDVYRVSLPALISQVKSRRIDPQIWETISPLNVYYSAPLSIGGHLLAFGGMLSGSGVTSIQHYQPDTNKWVKVSDMASPRYNCTCAVTNNGDILIAGGSKEGSDTCTCDIASVDTSVRAMISA